MKIATLVPVLLLALAPTACRKELGAAGLTTVGGEGDPCAGRTRCVVVYLAPWCGACKLSLPLIANLRRELEARTIGFRIVVGSGPAEALRAMAAQIGGRVQLDERGEFARAAGVRSFPSWWLLDGQARVRAHFSGGARSSGNASVDLGFLRQKLPELADELASPGHAPAPAAPAASVKRPIRPSLKPDPDCSTATSSDDCRSCCARVASTGFVWVHGAGCRCPR
jgi:hypothetical protein